VTLKIESRRDILSEPPDQPRHDNRTDQQPEHQRKKRYHRSYEQHVGRPHQNSSAALELRFIPRLSAATSEHIEKTQTRGSGGAGINTKAGRPAGRPARQRHKSTKRAAKKKTPHEAGPVGE
jgi:hypothetical protein